MAEINIQQENLKRKFLIYAISLISLLIYSPAHAIVEERRYESNSCAINYVTNSDKDTTNCEDYLNFYTKSIKGPKISFYEKNAKNSEKFLIQEDKISENLSILIDPKITNTEIVDLVLEYKKDIEKIHDIDTSKSLTNRIKSMEEAAYKIDLAIQNLDNKASKEKLELEKNALVQFIAYFKKEGDIVTPNLDKTEIKKLFKKDLATGLALNIINKNVKISGSDLLFKEFVNDNKSCDLRYTVLIRNMLVSGYDKDKLLLYLLIGRPSEAYISNFFLEYLFDVSEILVSKKITPLIEDEFSFGIEKIRQLQKNIDEAGGNVSIISKYEVEIADNINYMVHSHTIFPYVSGITVYDSYTLSTFLDDSSDKIDVQCVTIDILYQVISQVYTNLKTSTAVLEGHHTTIVELSNGEYYYPELKKYGRDVFNGDPKLLACYKKANKKDIHETVFLSEQASAYINSINIVHKVTTPENATKYYTANKFKESEPGVLQTFNTTKNPFIGDTIDVLLRKDVYGDDFQYFKMLSSYSEYLIKIRNSTKSQTFIDKLSKYNTGDNFNSENAETLEELNKKLKALQNSKNIE